MRKIIYLFAVLIALFLSSCTDDLNQPVLNESLIRNQLAALSVPTGVEIQAKVFTPSSQKKVKSEEFISQRVLPLDKEYYEVTSEYAIKLSQYYEVASNGELLRNVQLSQKFSITNGILDTTNWSGSVSLRGVGIKACSLWFSEDITSMVVFFRKDNGLQLAYRANLYDGFLHLPALAGGTWQVQVEAGSRGFYQTFLTMPMEISKESPENPLFLYLDIVKYTDPKENTVAIATVKPQSLVGNFLFVCEDGNGNMFSQPIPVTVSCSIMFSIPFIPKYIYTWGKNPQFKEVTTWVENEGLYYYDL